MDSMRGGATIRALVLAMTAMLLAAAAASAAPGSIEIDELARSAANANVADVNSRHLVLAVAHPNFTNHYGGQIKFGPDGFLYAGTGDGGSGGDPNGNARNLSRLLGKLLRLDVSPGARGFDPYAIPAGNPAAANPRCSGGSGTAPCPEVVASGLRNPFRFSFDSGAPHDLWIGDVGQENWEEIDHIAVANLPGVSFGWDCKEGDSDYSSPTPATGCPPPNYVGPIHTYANPTTGSRAVTGGLVVRDPALTPLVGRYLYADFYLSTLRSLDPAVGTTSDRPESSLSASSVASFGEDAAGHVYVVSLGGSVDRVVCTATPCAMSDLGLVPAYTDSVADAVDTPISVAAPPGDPSRLFIVERSGRIRVAVDSGSGYVVQDTPFLDIRSQVSTTGEGGLLSMAFDPEYATTGLFYIYFVNNGTTAPAFPGPPPSPGPDPGSPPAGSGTPPADQPPAGERPVAVRDSTAPVLRIRLARRQDVLHRRVVRLSVACDENCIVRATGRIRGVRASATPARASGLTLRSSLKRLAAGKRVVFELRVPARARRALAKRGVIALSIRGRDAAGNLRAAARTVQVKR
jgi:glucose/arabinose dehydrogenase